MAIGLIFVVWPLLAFVGLSFVAFLILTVYIYVIHRRYDHIPGPPYSSFYLGHLSELRKYHVKGEFVGKLLHQWVEKYGPVMKFFVAHDCIVNVTGASGIRDVGTKSKIFIKTPKTYKDLFKLCGVRFMGKGLLTETDHYTWHKRRVALNPAFYKKHLKMFMSRFNSVGDKWVEKLSTLADGQTFFNMQDHLCRVTLDAVSEVAFSYKMNSVETSSNVYLDHILNILKGIAYMHRDPMTKWYLTKRQFRRDVGESVRFLRTLGMKLLHQRKAMIASGEAVPEDVLTYIIRAQGVIGDSLTDEEVLDDFVTFFVAGQETTANALSFFFGEIGRRPEIALKLQEEVDRVLGDRTSITFDDLNQLEYVGQVFKESIRMYPPAPGTTRMNVEEVTIDGIRIPKHSNIIVNFYVVQRLAKHYEDPNDFIPERFSPDAERKLFTFLPFSVGPRSCIGQQFALIEAKVLISKFFQRFSMKLDPNQSLEIAGEVATLRPKWGIMMSVSSRS